MPKLKFDVSGSDAERAASGGFEMPKPGIYAAKLIECKLVDKKSNPDEQQLMVRYEITETGPYKGYNYLRDYIQFGESSEWKFDMFLQAIGVASKSKRTGELDTDALERKQPAVKVKIKADSYTPQGSTEPVQTVRVNGVFAPGSKAASNGSSQAATKFSAEEPEEDEDIPESEDEDIEDEDIEALIELADAEDEEATARLYEIGGEVGVDPDEYDTWADWLEAYNLAVIDESEAEGDDGAEIPDYSTWEIGQLQAECKTRGLPSKGTRSVLITRLEKHDAENPFD